MIFQFVSMAPFSDAWEPHFAFLTILPKITCNLREKGCLRARVLFSCLLILYTKSNWLSVVNSKCLHIYRIYSNGWNLNFGSKNDHLLAFLSSFVLRQKGWTETICRVWHTIRQKTWVKLSQLLDAVQSPRTFRPVVGFRPESGFNLSLKVEVKDCLLNHGFNTGSNFVSVGVSSTSARS